MNQFILPPVSERIRVSCRTTARFADAVSQERIRRVEHGEQGGASFAEASAVALMGLAELEVDDLHRTFRRSLLVATMGQEVHLQPRIPGPLVEYLDIAVDVMRRRYYEREASRRTLLIAGYWLYVRDGVGSPYEHQGNIKATRRPPEPYEKPEDRVYGT